MSWTNGYYSKEIFYYKGKPFFKIKNFPTHLIGQPFKYVHQCITENLDVLDEQQVSAYYIENAVNFYGKMEQYPIDVIKFAFPDLYRQLKIKYDRVTIEVHKMYSPTPCGEFMCIQFVAYERLGFMDRHIYKPMFNEQIRFIRTIKPLY
jgi:hypothetical protein